MTLDELERLSHMGKQDSRPAWLRAALDEPENRASYYRYLYELARVLKPAVIVETGTRFGNSAAQMAFGSPGSRLITMDIEPSSVQQAARFGLKNIEVLTGDSANLVSVVSEMAPSIDMLFLDSEHRYHVASREYKEFRPLVKTGGIILMDDIDINPEMKKVWDEVVDPKKKLGHLHYMGFGVAIKDGSRKL